MSIDDARPIAPREAWIVRLGGLAGLVTIAIAFIISFGLTPQSPPGAAPPEEFADFFSAHADSMALANGLRNLALFLIPLWAVGLYSLIARAADAAAKAWAAMGVVSFAAVMALGTVNNLLQTAAFAQLSVFTEHPELRRLLWSAAGVGFGGASRLVWAAINAGFSIAGWLSGAIPRWLCVVGLIAAAASLVTAVAIADWLAGGWLDTVDLVVFVPATLIFQVGLSVQMIRRAAR